MELKWSTICWTVSRQSWKRLCVWTKIVFFQRPVYFYRRQSWYGRKLSRGYCRSSWRLKLPTSCENHVLESRRKFSFNPLNWIWCRWSFPKLWKVWQRPKHDIKVIGFFSRLWEEAIHFKFFQSMKIGKSQFSILFGLLVSGLTFFFGGGGGISTTS